MERALDERMRVFFADLAAIFFETLNRDAARRRYREEREYPELVDLGGES